MSERPRRSRWTIRLRTLLLLVLAICCGLGWLSYERRKGARTQKLAQDLTHGGSKIEFEACDFWGRKAAEPAPVWQRWLFGDSYFQRIVGAEINEPAMLSEKGRQLSELRDLRSLGIRGTGWGFTDQHASALAPLRHLEVVSLPDTRLSDQGLAALSPENPLRGLDVSGSLVTDAGLSHLAKFKTLEVLTLDRTQITDEGMKQIARLPALKHLFLGRMMVSTEGVRELAQSKTLESLTVHDLPLWPEAFAAVVQAPRLQHLIIGNSQIYGAQDLKKMREDKLLQEQAAFALGPLSVYWAINLEEKTVKAPYLRWLLEHGADPNDRSHEMSPLRWLVTENALEPVRTLLEYGAHVNEKDGIGRTPLAIAADLGRHDMVRLLLAGGADPNSGYAALYFAAMRGHLEVAQELIAHGADVKRTDHTGDTALHYAAATSHLDMVKLLLEHGADPMTTNQRGETPSASAQRQISPHQPNAAEIVSLLQSANSPATSASGSSGAAAAPGPTRLETVVKRTPKMRPLPANATLEQAYERMAADSDFKPYLRALWDQFPEVEVTPPEAPAKWTTVTLNQKGARMDAMRFTSTLNEAADMRWCFIHPRNGIAAWFIAPMKGEMTGFDSYWVEEAVDTENLDESANNNTIYQALGGGQILPGEEYLLWFTFPNAQPVEMHVAVKLVPSTGQSQNIYGATAIAMELGLQVPLRRHAPKTAETFLQRAAEVAETDLQTAVELIESGLQRSPNDRELLVAASNLNRRYAEEVLQVDREAAAPIYEKAAAQARAAAGQREDLTYKERLSLVYALLDEARVNAERQDADKTIALIGEALEAGLTSISKLNETEAYSFLKDNPQYVSLLNRWRGLMKPPRSIDYEQKPHPADAIEFNGHWYQHFPGMLPWHLAQLRCKEKGGYLACVETEAEAKFLHEHCPKGGLWLGGVVDGGDDGRWINGQPLSYAPWEESAPLASGEETRVMLGSNGRWFAVGPVDQKIVGYLCEWDQ